jgi:hypothetical protein
MDPTIEALTIHPAAWAAFLQGLADGVAYGVAVVAGGLVVIVVSIACLGGRKSAEDDLDAATEPMVWGPRRSQGARRRRRVCQRRTQGWSVIAHQTESVG